MHKEKEWLLLEKYHGEKTEGFFADCIRLQSGEPLAYIIGHVPFLNTTIYLDSQPLIPRPETEFWTHEILTHITSNHNDRSEPCILDLCAGSGCVGVAILKAVPYVYVDFVEIEAIHHPTIIKNCEMSGAQPGRYTVYGGDLFSEIANKQYAYILANPPYIDKDRHTVEDSVTAHEPHRALFGGIEGLEVISRIIKEASRYLSNTGVLLVEHEPFQSNLIKDLGKENGFTTEIRYDQYGVDRYTLLTRSNSTLRLE